MECQIRFNLCKASARCRRHRIHRGLHAGKQFGISPFGGNFGGSGLENQPHLEQILDEMRRGSIRQMPTQHIRVEQVPIRRGPYPRSRLGPRFRQALGRQKPHRFAYRGARNAKFGLNFGFGRDHISVCDEPGNDAAAQRIGNTVGQPHTLICARARKLRPCSGHGHSASPNPLFIV